MSWLEARPALIPWLVCMTVDPEDGEGSEEEDEEEADDEAEGDVRTTFVFLLFAGGGELCPPKSGSPFDARLNDDAAGILSQGKQQRE